VSELGKVDYKSGATQRPSTLEVPPDLTRPGRDDRYYVEGESSAATLSDYQKGAQDKPAASAQTSGVLPEVGKMSIGRAGNERWLIVPGNPAQLWPRVRQFWLDNGFTLVIDRPEIGVMETDWLENRAAIKQDFIREALGKTFDGLYTSPEKDRYRTRLEPGTAPDTVEIYISHRGLEEELSPQKDSSSWVWRKPDPGLEAEMLRRLMLALGVEEKSAHDLIANAASSDKARFESASDGGMQLSFVEGFDQSWRQIGLALDRAGFIVEDRDRTAGVYDVRAVAAKSDKKEDASWFSRLKFWGKRNDQAQEKTGEPFKVLVKGDDKASTVRVLDKSGNVDKSDAANKMLQLLLEQIK